jgi:FtsP/CotA-like multicopper oxidase with cupredoxin domain
MSALISRREMLVSAAAVAAVGALGPVAALAQTPAVQLTVARRTLEVNGKAASMLGIHAADGKPGAILDPGQRFTTALANSCGDPTIVHWHGQEPPPEQDGVIDTGYVDAMNNGTSRTYDFAPRPGTYWMHSHYQLQEQQLAAAPLIVRTPDDLKADREEVVVLLQDFSFKDPVEILSSLTKRMPNMPPAAAASGPPPQAGAAPAMKMDLNDIDYDAFLANGRTLADPEVVTIERGGKVLVRLINASAATEYWIDLGGVEAQLVATDGNPVAPVTASRFPLAIAQRLDLLVTVPAGGVVPVLAQREGDKARTGVLLAATGATVAKVAPAADAMAGPVDLSLETGLSALAPLAPRAADITHQVVLSGAMRPYAWTINGRPFENRVPLNVSAGKRVVLDMQNMSMMSHPMHLHGHHFQVIAVNGRPFSGAKRDTVLVPPMTRVSVAFDADNPGRWLFHCHNLYHMNIGMMTEVIYDNV